MKLGPLNSLSRNMMNMYQPSWNPYGDDNGPSPLARKSEFEAVATSADSLEFTIGVSVSYHLAGGR